MILDIVFNKHINVSKRKANGERISRSIAKSLSWRIVGTLDTILISWLITGQIALALSIGSIEVITKMVVVLFSRKTLEYD